MCTNKDHSSRLRNLDEHRVRPRELVAVAAQIQGGNLDTVVAILGHGIIFQRVLIHGRVGSDRIPKFAVLDDVNPDQDGRLALRLYVQIDVGGVVENKRRVAHELAVDIEIERWPGSGEGPAGLDGLVQLFRGERFYIGAVLRCADCRAAPVRAIKIVGIMGIGRTGILCWFFCFGFISQ